MMPVTNSDVLLIAKEEKFKLVSLREKERDSKYWMTRFVKYSRRCSVLSKNNTHVCAKPMKLHSLPNIIFFDREICTDNTPADNP